MLDLLEGQDSLELGPQQGSQSAVIVDDNPSAVNSSKQICQLRVCPRNGCQGRCFQIFGRDEKFDIILDPPFESRLLTKALQKIIEFDKLNDGGIIICEGPADEEPGELASLYKKIKSKKYGKKRITLYTREDG